MVLGSGADESEGKVVDTDADSDDSVVGSDTSSEANVNSLKAKTAKIFLKTSTVPLQPTNTPPPAAHYQTRVVRCQQNGKTNTSGSAMAPPTYCKCGSGLAIENP